MMSENETINAAEATTDEPTSHGAEAGSQSTSEESTSHGEEAGSESTIATESIVEAILLAGDAPVGAAKVAGVIGDVTPGRVKECIHRLNARYEEIGAAFRIEEIAKGYQILTLPEYNVWLRKLLKVRSETKLSQAALETLAVVAYRQPVLRAKIEEIRGVGAGEMLNRLREMNLVKIVGRAEELGRPLLYGTTKRFLEVFGLASLSDLPKVDELTPPDRQRKSPETTTETAASIPAETGAETRAETDTRSPAEAGAESHAETSNETRAETGAVPRSSVAEPDAPSSEDDAEAAFARLANAARTTNVAEPDDADDTDDATDARIANDTGDAPDADERDAAENQGQADDVTDTVDPA